MELHELQKMISIIHDKKPRCRGNLRVKVLLKSTHDYVRRSLLDDQLGNSESLMTLLRNSGTVRESMSLVNTTHETVLHSTNSERIVEKADSHSEDCDSMCIGNNQDLQCSGSANQNLRQDSENSFTMIEPLTESDDNNNQSLNNIPIQSVVSDEHRDAFRIRSKSTDKNNPKQKYSKLIKALRKIMKNWELLMSKAKSEKHCLKYHCHSVKRMRKLLLESKVCFKADFENQSFAQQQMIQMYVRVIKKMLKQCDKILERR